MSLSDDNDDMVAEYWPHLLHTQFKELNLRTKKKQKKNMTV